MTRACPLQDLLDFRTVAESDRGTRGINSQLARQVPGNLLLVIEEQALEISDVAELSPVRQRATGIDRLREVEIERLPIFPVAWFMFSFAQRPIFVAPTAEHVEVFQCKARGINLRVTGVARFLSAMLFELFADGGR